MYYICVKGVVSKTASTHLIEEEGESNGIQQIC